MDIVPIAAGIEFIFFLAAATVLCFRFSLRIMLITHCTSPEGDNVSILATSQAKLKSREWNPINTYIKNGPDIQIPVGSHQQLIKFLIGTGAQYSILIQWDAEKPGVRPGQQN